MPCSARKAHILLKKGEARVVKTNPFFIIQMTKATGEQVQACSLGIDSGSKFIGFSVITGEKELITGELVVDCKTSKRLIERKMYRKFRRYKLRYRQPKHNNRSTNRKELSPSIQRKFDTHVTLINKISNIVPVTKLTVEVGNFDIQKIENPDIKGIQYQQGSLFEYENMRSFLMAREHGKCQLCEKEFSRGNPSHIHHIISRKQGGSDKENNLALLHKKCHIKLHKNKLFGLLKENKNYRDATFMNIVRGKFRKVFPDSNLTFGNETFVIRNALRLEKAHFNDAFVIAGGINQKKLSPIFLKQKHRNNRVLQLNRKGSNPTIRRQRHKIQPYDLIWVGNNRYVVKGCHKYGQYALCTDGIKKFDVNIKKISKIFHTNSLFQVISYA
jgi:hypothetical protein